MDRSNLSNPPAAGLPRWRRRGASDRVAVTAAIRPVAEQAFEGCPAGDPRPDEHQAVGGSLGEPHLDGRSLETGPGREDHEDGQNAKPEQRYPLSRRCEAKGLLA